MDYDKLEKSVDQIVELMHEVLRMDTRQLLDSRKSQLEKIDHDHQINCRLHQELEVEISEAKKELLKLKRFQKDSLSKLLLDIIERYQKYTDTSSRIAGKRFLDGILTYESLTGEPFNIASLRRSNIQCKLSDRGIKRVRR